MQLTTQIREEYSKLQNKYSQLQIDFEKYKNYVEQLQQKSSRKTYEKPIRKRKYYDLERDYYEHEQEDSDESDTYITEKRKKSKKPKIRIIYEEEEDGVSDRETDSHFSEEEQDIKPEEKSQIRKNKQPKKFKKGLLNQ